MKTQDTISALVDGELDSEGLAEAIRTCCTNTEAAGAWQRFHLIGDALRDDLPPHLDAGFASRVASAVALEPAILAPRRATPTAPPLRWVAGLAVAASCAALVVFSGSVFNHGQGDGSPASGLIAAASPPPSSDNGLSAAGQSVAETPGSTSDTVPVSGEHFNPYLVRHLEFQMHAGTPGMNPYARLIGHQPEDNGTLASPAAATYRTPDARLPQQ